MLTRRTDVFVPLEERTAMANREGADLFLSIHANSSRNSKAGGVETYFLNFASNPDAEAVAARENSASGRTMHSLPDIVRAITLNNKLDESRDFATLVQRAMIESLAKANRRLRDRGVKQAPFVVLDWRRNAERARRDLVHDAQPGEQAAEDAGVPPAHRGSRCSRASAATSGRSRRSRRLAASQE